MIVGRFQLDAESGAWFAAALQQYTRLEESRSEPTIDGETTVVTPVRTPGQAKADALGEICRAAMASEQAGTATGGERPRIVVTAGIETLDRARAEDARRGGEDCSPNGPFPSRADSRPGHQEYLGLIGTRLLNTMACDSVLQQAVFAPSGAALSLGREVRTVSKAQRRMLNARDRGCVLPGCTAPARRCQAHHVIWWRRGGPTDVANLALVCASCHTQIHLGAWDLVMVDGIPWARPPAYLDPLRRLIRNTFHDRLDQVTRLKGSGRTRGSEGDERRYLDRKWETTTEREEVANDDEHDDTAPDTPG
jgi:hypothetical protein